jgi:hypothetical protein
MVTHYRREDTDEPFFLWSFRFVPRDLKALDLSTFGIGLDPQRGRNLTDETVGRITELLVFHAEDSVIGNRL